MKSLDPVAGLTMTPGVCEPTLAPVPAMVPDKINEVFADLRKMLADPQAPTGKD